MNKSRGSRRPAWAAAAVDAGYAQRHLAACAARAASLGGQAGAGGRTDVELLIALSDRPPWGYALGAGCSS